MSEDPDARRNDGWIEIVIAIVLSAGGLMTSWASYQAALWDGEQAAHYSRANAIRVMATRARLEADAHRTAEMALFNAWLQTVAEDRKTLASFYEARFPRDMKPAFDAWIEEAPLKNPDAPQTPFAMPAYQPQGMIQAQKLEAQADATFEVGQENNRVSDLFTQGAVILAMAMFFGGIGQVFRMRPVRLALLAISILACAIGLARILTLPTLSPG